MMKLTYLLILFLLVESCSGQVKLGNEYYPYRKGNLWGISDESGNMKIEPSYVGIKTKLGYFIAKATADKYDVFNSNSEKILTADSVVLTADSSLLALNFINEYAYKDAFIQNYLFGNKVLTDNVKRHQYFAKGVVLQKDKEIIEIKHTLAIQRRRDANAREPIDGFLIDSMGYKGFQHVSPSGFFIHPQYKNVNFIWGYYIFYNSTEDFIVLKKTYKNDALHYEVIHGFNPIVIQATNISFKGGFIFIDSNKHRSVYNKKGDLLRNYEITQKFEGLSLYYDPYVGSDITSIPYQDGFKFMDTNGSVVELETKGLQSCSERVWKTEESDTANHRSVITSFIDIKHLKYFYKKQQPSDTLICLRFWYVVQKGKERSFYNANGNLLFKVPASKFTKYIDTTHFKQDAQYNNLYGIREGFGKPYHISSAYNKFDDNYIADDYHIGYRNVSAIVQKNGKWGVINYNLRELISPQYDSIIDVGHNVFTVKKDGKYLHVDTNNKKLFRGKYLDHIYEEPFDGYVICIKGTRKNTYEYTWDEVYVADTNGNIVHTFDKREYRKGTDFELLKNGLIVYFNNLLNQYVFFNVNTKKTIRIPKGYRIESYESLAEQDIAVSITNEDTRDINVFSLVNESLLFIPNGKYNRFNIEPYNSNSVFIYNHGMPVGIYSNKGVKLYND